MGSCENVHQYVASLVSFVGGEVKLCSYKSPQILNEEVGFGKEDILFVMGRGNIKTPDGDR